MRRWYQRLARWVGCRRVSRVDNDGGPPLELEDDTDLILEGPDAPTAEFPALDPDFIYTLPEGDLIRPYYWMTENTMIFRRFPSDYPGPREDPLADTQIFWPVVGED